MDNLKQKVEDLEKLSDEGEIVKQLQEIGKMLLTDYVIKVGDITVEPLWVEAYYYNESKNFIDSSVHKNEKQEEFGVFYFHPKKAEQRSGVDISLSLSKDKGKDSEKYYLSYLLKYTLVNGVFTTQSQLKNKIPNELKDSKEIILAEKRPANIIQHTSRIGIGSGNFINAELATIRDINQRFNDSNGKQRSLPNKIAILKNYVDAVYSEEEKASEEQKKLISKALVGEYWKDLFE